ncbi:GNAT family N-acetyltransferase [Pseudogemmobacter faecipullorum]|uniref:GNAT family N-acetyltransferase n=1 Tax=Pseudogemmobacter faecipullorum TaxID=2755041 RepID=A0ABS8CPW6_9RHOB|nr:GNAT family N-acetyltransferase [Pseudogemmobacter faecipullorum]MCB5411432.1 GNAT family N-acetyltransferase [Pseudogemmobacter faecipullorum]
MSVTIRPLCPADEPVWRQLWTQYLEFYESSVPEQVYETTFKRLTDPEVKAQFGLIAEAEGRAIGLVHGIFHPHNWRVEEVCYLQDLFVSPEARGTGAGRALIEAVYARADANGTPAVYWLTQEFNATARQLYDRIARVTPFIKYQR